MLDLENLAPVFGDDNISFLSEDATLLRWLDEQGLAALSIADVADLAAGPPENAVVTLLTWDGDLPAAQLRRWGEALSGSRVLSLPVAFFDTSMGAATYTIEQVLRSDFVSASARCARWVDEIHDLGLDERLRFTGSHTDVEVALGRKLATGSRIQPQVNPGERVSAISYFELEFESPNAGTAEFSVDGTLEVTGMLVARGSTVPAELLSKWRMAKELVRTMYSGAAPEIIVTIESNHFISIALDGREMLPFFAELTNSAYEAKVLEFSIGTNESVRGRADWSLNSFINEGHAGVHVAMGDGTTGPHVDFVCTDVQYTRSP